MTVINETHHIKLTLDLKVHLESEKVHVILPAVDIVIKKMQKPLLIPQQLHPNAIREDFNRRLNYKMPEPKPVQRIQMPQDLYESQGFLIANEMHNISTHNQHYTASSFWMHDKSNIALFWRTIAANRPGAIVKLINNDKFINSLWFSAIPCYYPKEVGETLVFSDYLKMPKVVCIKKEEITDSLTLRILEVATANETFRIPHIDFTGWPDFGVPDLENFKSLMDVLKRECPVNSPEKRIFVHCQGGMGRTGTFIAAHAGSQIPREQRIADLFFNIIMDMRSQRPRNMVEKPDQYLFLHQFVNTQ